MDFKINVDYRVHLSQAKHNEEVALKLVNEPPYHDWGITAGFYSAIHYFECCFLTGKKNTLKQVFRLGEMGNFYTPLMLGGKKLWRKA